MRKQPNTAGTDVLVRPCLSSFVEIAKILRTSTIIFTIMSVIAAVGGTSTYVSSRLKKLSTRSKTSTRKSWLSLTSLAACDPRISERRVMASVERGTHQKEDPGASKYDLRR